MKTLIASLLFAASCATSLVAEESVVTIHPVNGKNGKLITDENLNVFRNGSGFAENYRADSNGVISLHIDRTDTVAFNSNIQVTCHPYGSNEHIQRWYRVSEIMEHGISDENFCSKKVYVKAKPGEFIFYERPRTLWEWMAL